MGDSDCVARDPLGGRDEGDLGDGLVLPSLGDSRRRVDAGDILDKIADRETLPLFGSFLLLVF